MNQLKNKHIVRKQQIFNGSSSGGWGSLYFWMFFTIAVLLGIAGILHNRTLAKLDVSSVYPWFRILFLVLVFCFSAVALVIAYLSYPRIHNLKILLLGSFTFLLHVFYLSVRITEFITDTIPKTHTFTITIYCLLAINFLLVFGLPSFTKYRLAKAVLFFTVTGEFLFLFYMFIGFTGHVPVPSFSVGTYGWLLPLFAAGIVTMLSLKLVNDEYKLGGALSGIGWVYGISASVKLSSIPFDQALILEEIAFSITSGLVLVTMISNWLMLMSHRLYYDPLTQIYNREYCEAILSERSNIVFTKPSCVAMFDIDKFKKVNDTYGHAAGDRILQHVAQNVSQQVVPHGIACRYGGEEIIVFFPGIKLNDASDICFNVRQSVEDGWVQSGRRKLRVTISGGVAELSDRYSNLRDALKAADKALYEAKDTGRNKVVISGKRKVRRKTK